MRASLLAIWFSALTVLLGDEFFPKPGWTDKPDPIAGAEAEPGGEISMYGGQQPHSLNYYLDYNSFSVQVFLSMYETLLDTDPVTADYTPCLARRWSVSDDRRTFTFWVDERARWSDGTPVTAADVLWTYEAIMNTNNLTGVHRVALEKFEKPTLVESNGVRFVATEVHWRNLGAVGTFPVMPRHVFATQDFNKVNFLFPVMSGPYRLGEFKENGYLKLERRPDWWRRVDRRCQKVANFQTIVQRFYEERENAFEAFKKGLLDVYPVNTARLWVNETSGDRFDRNWIVKQKVVNHQPIGFQGFAMNMRRPPFDDSRVRLAMAHLLDREKLNKTIMYSQYFLHRSYFEDLYDKQNPCNLPLIAFDKEKARQLLKEAGWAANPKTGLLEKGGKPFSFRFLSSDQGSDKFLAIFSEDLKDVGIELRIDRKDQAAWTRDMDEFNYDMTWAAWSAGLFKDPEDMWASMEATRIGGHNITGFKDADVDAMIEKQRTIFDVQERHQICREIDKRIVAQTPYVLLWNLNYVRLLYWNKFGMPATVLSKYGDSANALWYWWHDPDAAAELESAMKSGVSLPPRPASVVFDDSFKP